jgi:hypothetical protein
LGTGEDRRHGAGTYSFAANDGRVLTCFVFLCVSGFYWLASLFGPVAGAVLMASLFAFVGVAAFLTVISLRSRTRRLALAARQAHRAALLANPAILEITVAAGRKLGWHRTIPLALLAVIAMQATSAIGARLAARDE